MIELKDLVMYGLKNGHISLENNEDTDEVVARIGEYWFYFGSDDCDDYFDKEDDIFSAERFKERVPLAVVCDNIVCTLESMKTDLAYPDEKFNPEYLYYESYLHEALENDMSEYLSEDQSEEQKDILKNLYLHGIKDKPLSLLCDSQIYADISSIVAEMYLSAKNKKDLNNRYNKLQSYLTEKGSFLYEYSGTDEGVDVIRNRCRQFSKEAENEYMKEQKERYI